MKKILLFLLFFGLSFSVFAERNIPEYHNFVNDYANIFSESEENILNQKLSDLEKKSSSEFAILTINSLNGDSLEDYSIDVARKWGIGKKDLDNGLLLLIVKNDRKIRFEVGYGLEGKITDAQSFWLIEDILKPNFRQNNFFGGVNQVVDKVSGVILNGKELPKKEKNNPKNFLYGLYAFLIAWIGSFLAGYFIYFRKYKFKNTYLEFIKTPYKNYHPFLTGFLIDRKMDNSDLMAGIIYLANKGYIEIQKNIEKKFLKDKEEYTFALKVSENEVQDELDKLLIELIFNSGFSKKIKNHGFYLKKSLSSLVNSPEKVRSKKNKLEKWLRSYAVKNNILDKKSLTVGILKFIPEWILTILFVVFIIVFQIASLFVVILLLFYIPFVFIQYRYKKKGWEIKYQLESFKNYLKNGVLDENEKTKEKFLEFLPYAFAFEVEKDWAKKFNQNQIPKWYKDFSQKNNFLDDLNEIEKIIGGIAVSDLLLHTINSYSGSGSSWSVSSGGGSSFGGFGGGSFGGGGVLGGW